MLAAATEQRVAAAAKVARAQELERQQVAGLVALVVQAARPVMAAQYRSMPATQM